MSKGPSLVSKGYRMVLSNIGATSPLRLCQFNEKEIFKNQIFRYLHHVSNAQYLHGASGHHVAQHRHRTFLLFQKVVLGRFEPRHSYS